MPQLNLCSANITKSLKLLLLYLVIKSVEYYIQLHLSFVKNNSIIFYLLVVLMFFGLLKRFATIPNNFTRRRNILKYT